MLVDRGGRCTSTAWSSRTRASCAGASTRRPRPTSRSSAARGVPDRPAGRQLRRPVRMHPRGRSQDHDHVRLRRDAPAAVRRVLHLRVRPLLVDLADPGRRLRRDPRARPPLPAVRLVRVRRLRAALPGRRLHQPRLAAVPDPGRADGLVHALPADRAAPPLAGDQRAHAALEAQARNDGAGGDRRLRALAVPARAQGRARRGAARRAVRAGRPGARRAQRRRSGAPIEDVTVGCAFPEGEQGMNLGAHRGRARRAPRSVAGATSTASAARRCRPSTRPPARSRRHGRGLRRARASSR